jgi:hypothetical protein
VDLIFTRVKAKTERKIHMKEFELALDEMARVKVRGPSAMTV